MRYSWADMALKVLKADLEETRQLRAYKRTHNRLKMWGALRDKHLIDLLDEFVPALPKNAGKKINPVSSEK